MLEQEGERETTRHVDHESLFEKSPSLKEGTTTWRPRYNFHDNDNRSLRALASQSTAIARRSVRVYRETHRALLSLTAAPHRRLSIPEERRARSLINRRGSSQTEDNRPRGEFRHNCTVYSTARLTASQLAPIIRGGSLDHSVRRTRRRATLRDDRVSNTRPADAHHDCDDTTSRLGFNRHGIAGTTD